MGLLISVYRNSEFGDCTNNGVSARYNKLCVTNVDGPFYPDEDTPEVRLEMGPFNSLRLAPVNESKRHTMMGGNYAGTSDSRFNEACRLLNGSSPGVVAIHDRVEW
jgi:hypothetical protein